MKNLFDATVANQLKTRLGKLEPQSERRWGKMTAAQMLAHCSVSMQWAVGELVPEKGALPARLMGAGEANGVSERRPATEEFADGQEPHCG
jgi:hypothetical protein